MITAGIVPSSDGWFDDDVVFVEPWGFDLVVDPRARCSSSTASRTDSCRSRTASGSQNTSPTPKRGSVPTRAIITLGLNVVPAVHEWLLARFEAGPNDGRPLARPSVLYGSKTSRPSMATPSGRSVCFTRIESRSLRSRRIPMKTPGIWPFHCHVNDYIRAGMVTRYQALVAQAASGRSRPGRGDHSISANVRRSFAPRAGSSSANQPIGRGGARESRARTTGSRAPGPEASRVKHRPEGVVVPAAGVGVLVDDDPGDRLASRTRREPGFARVQSEALALVDLDHERATARGRKTRAPEKVRSSA